MEESGEQECKLYIDWHLCIVQKLLMFVVLRKQLLRDNTSISKSFPVTFITRFNSTLYPLYPAGLKAFNVIEF